MSCLWHSWPNKIYLNTYLHSTSLLGAKMVWSFAISTASKLSLNLQDLLVMGFAKRFCSIGSWTPMVIIWRRRLGQIVLACLLVFGSQICRSVEIIAKVFSFCSTLARMLLITLFKTYSFGQCYKSIMAPACLELPKMPDDVDGWKIQPALHDITGWMHASKNNVRPLVLPWYRRLWLQK